MIISFFSPKESSSDTNLRSSVQNSYITSTVTCDLAFNLSGINVNQMSALWDKKAQSLKPV